MRGIVIGNRIEVNMRLSMKSLRPFFPLISTSVQIALNWHDESAKAGLR